jgi:prepilin-type N-terminal cleavage/methylation domain-containing protein
MTRERQGGFSLIELLVAMTITLIVSGAIYGLLASGQNAFRREPELTERQQNIRLAMDMIMRDTAGAGVGLPPFAQVFTTGLDDDTASPQGPSGENSDALEMLTGGARESEPVCAYVSNWTSESLYLTRQQVPALDPGASERLMFLVFSRDMAWTADDRWTARRLTAQATGTFPSTTSGAVPPNCTGGGDHATLTFDDATAGNAANLCQNAPLPPAGNIVTTACGAMQLTRVVFADQVRYQIRSGPDGVPVLERSSTANPGVFETLARGIEELQVQYTQVLDPDTWVDDAPIVADPTDAPPGPPENYGTLVNQVRVTLTSRSEAPNLAGASTGAGSTGTHVRGSLTSTSAPRATLMHLARNRPSPVPSPGTWYWE